MHSGHPVQIFTVFDCSQTLDMEPGKYLLDCKRYNTYSVPMFVFQKEKFQICWVSPVGLKLLRESWVQKVQPLLKGYIF